MKVQLEKLEELSYEKKEAFNYLRTNLSFCGDNIKTIVFTSCTPDEGKSSTVMELGRSISENGKRVLIIDADLRKSVLVGRYHARKEAKEKEQGILGMSHYLSGQAGVEQVVYETNIERMDIIFAGHMTPGPTELLGNHYFDKLLEYARAHYDMVLIDSPPLGSVIDTAVIASKCDGAVLVIEANKCSYRFVQDIQKQLEVADCRILGCILNKVKTGKGSYYNRYYKGYYKGYYKEYYAKDTVKRDKKNVSDTM